VTNEAGTTDAVFRPVWWAPTGLLQTVAGGHVGPPLGAMPTELALERWDTPDGDFVRMHLSPTRDDKPWVLALHGLEGSVQSVYVQTLAAAAITQGWNFACMEFRSCGGEPNRLLRSYHSGETDDLVFVVDRLIRERGAKRLGVVGWSLGGNVLLKWLGEEGHRLPDAVRAAAAVSAPFDLALCAAACDLRHGGLFARYFLRSLIPKTVEKAVRFPGRLDPAAVRRCRTFRQFDDLVTGPVHGFHGAADYWDTQSCARFLRSIRRPTLLLNAADDPLVPVAAWPTEDVDRSSWLRGELLPRGGHVAFLSQQGWWRPRRWAEGRVMRWLHAHCGD
jgi:predicted alpha/beta-fold hydrolase